MGGSIQRAILRCVWEHTQACMLAGYRFSTSLPLLFLFGVFLGLRLGRPVPIHSRCVHTRVCVCCRPTRSLSLVDKLRALLHTTLLLRLALIYLEPCDAKTNSPESQTQTAGPRLACEAHPRARAPNRRSALIGLRDRVRLSAGGVAGMVSRALPSELTWDGL